MNRFGFWWVSVCMFIWLMPSAVSAAVPETLHYQGYLTNEEGEPAHCPSPTDCPEYQYDVTFRLYSQAQGGTPFWEETHYSISLNYGSFNVVLGSTKPIDGTQLDETTHLGVEVVMRGPWGSWEPGEMEPRHSFASAAFALQAKSALRSDLADDAAMLGGQVPEDFVTYDDVGNVCVTDDELASFLSDGEYINDANLDGYLEAHGYETGSVFSGDFSDLTGVPPDLADGDLDTLSVLVCEGGQIAKYNGIAWICQADADTVASLVCGVGQIAKWNGMMWACAHDDDVLNSMDCAADKVPRFNGAAWECQDDKDTVASLICSSNEIAKWNGVFWACSEDVDSLGSMSCPPNRIIHWTGTAWECKDDADTLASMVCTNGQVAKFDGVAWRCQDDIDTDTDTLNSLPCSFGDSPKFNGTAWTCEIDQDTLGKLVCVEGQVPQWTLTGWQCRADADTVGDLSCAFGQVAKWAGAIWNCAEDVDTVGALACAPTEIPKWNGVSWGCKSDADTMGSLVCGVGQIGKWMGTGWQCVADEDSLGGLLCIDDQVPKWTPTGWVCGKDADQNTLMEMLCDPGETLGTIGPNWVCTALDGSVRTVDCLPGEIAKWDGTSWSCTPDTDSLTSLACGPDEIAKWDGSIWSCSTDLDSLGALTCQFDELPKWNGVAWECKVDSDVVAKLVCATDQVAKWDGISWSCQDDVDTDTLPSILCEPDETLEFRPTLGEWACRTISDSFNPVKCTSNQTVIWDGLDWICADDVILTEAEVDAFADNNGYALDADLAAIAKSGDWADLQNVPADIADGDDDVVGALVCTVDQVIKWDGAAWICHTNVDLDTQLTEAEVDAFVANNGYALDADLAAIAKSGDWADLQNIPADIADGDDNTDTLAGLSCALDQVAKWDGSAWVCHTNADLNTQLSEAEVDAFVANNGFALEADLAAIAKSGDWADLLNVPAGIVDGDDDTLMSMMCPAGSVPEWLGLIWACKAADGSFSSLSCNPGQIPSWDGTNWICANDLDSNTDTLAALSCATDQVAKWDGSAWVCHTNADLNTQLSEAEVDAFVANNGYALDADLAAIAKSGDWADLQNIPADIADGDDNTDTLAALSCATDQVAKWDGSAWVCHTNADLNTQLSEAEVDAFVANNGYALDADLVAIAKSGDWADLQNIPADIADGDDNTDTLAGLS
ncbi:MAG: hypothetical protein CMH54_13260, partial [Myxococcales bacterium]|nr:hypothetical protein [Myxococcales bacterium]